jgi:gliding motility-associated-like protein
MLPDGQYILTYSLTGVNESEQSVTIEFSSGNSSFSIPADILLNIGTTTLSIVNLTGVNANCSAVLIKIFPVNFEVLDSITPSLIDEGNVFCIQDEPTIADLTNNIVGSNPITWYDAPTNGTPYSETTPLINNTTYYASALSANNCESSTRLEVTVVLEDCFEEIVIPDGFSPNGDGINDDFDIVNLRDLYPLFTLEIYNRYGNLLYKGNTNTPNWDGVSNKGITLGNSVVPTGVYFYILNFNDGNRNPIQGRVYLSR